MVEHSIQDPKSVEDVLNTPLPSGSVWSARVRVNGVVNTARHSGGVTLVGIEPE